MAQFILLSGLPASGKSSMAVGLSTKYNAVIVSSDAIRLELFDDENDQNHNTEVFAEMLQRTIELLEAGINVIYDSTNILPKYRKQLLKKLPPCEKICVVMNTPVDVCIERNKHRLRRVPDSVIMRMASQYVTPLITEGWDSIILNQ